MRLVAARVEAPSVTTVMSASFLPAYPVGDPTGRQGQAIILAERPQPGGLRRKLDLQQLAQLPVGVHLYHVNLRMGADEVADLVAERDRPQAQAGGRRPVFGQQLPRFLQREIDRTEVDQTDVGAIALVDDRLGDVLARRLGLAP